MRCKIPKAHEVNTQNPTNREIYEVATTFAVHHTLAYCLRALEIGYGFREKRLRQFMNEVGHVVKDDTAVNSMTSTELLNYMKKKYNIDIVNMPIE